MDLNSVIKFFENYEKDHVIQNLIAQANSRYILYNSLELEENFPKYTSNLDEKCLHISFSYLNFGWNLYNDYKGKSVYCIEKASEILEHLYAYGNCDKIYKEYYSLICALGYYVSSQYSKSFIVLKNYACKTDLARMIHCFATRNLRALDSIISNIHFQSIKDIEDSEINPFIYTRILSNAFNNMLNYIYTGTLYYLDASKQILLDLIELSSINDEPHIWWVFRLLYLIFDEYKTASLWSVLPTIITNTEDRNRYIYANIYKKNPIVELFRSQRECIQKSENYIEGFVVGMPTSSGKTKVAEISLIKVLSQFPNALCIYLAPFRSLANEIESSLSATLSVVGYSVSNLYGRAQATQKDRKIIETANVIIATPEKVKSILRANPDLESRIKLVVVDEGHLVGGQDRYITSELLIEELKASLNKVGGKLILLSAVLPNLSDFSIWVSGKKDNIVRSEWRPSAQRFGELSFSNHIVDINWIGDPPSYNNKFIEAKLIKEAHKTKTGKVYPPKYFPNDKKDAIAATAVKMLTMGSVLIFVGRSNMVISQARVIFKLMNELNIIHQWENMNDLKYVELTCEEAYGRESEIYSFVKQGIICHNSKLPTDVRLSIERLMKYGNPKIVIATSTLGQGVNLGVSTVIISNVNIDREQIVDVKDFWNIAGRAGRAFSDTEGKVLYAIDRTKTSYSVENQIMLMNRYFQYNNIEKATSGLLFLLKKLLHIANQCEINYDMLLELLAENHEIITRNSGKEFIKRSQHLLDLLDDTMLSLSIKYNADISDDCTSWIDQAFSNSLVFVQALKSTEINQNKVIDILKARNKGVIKIAGPPIQWKKLITSSLPLRATLYIDSYIDSLVNVVRQYIDSGQTFDELMQLVEEIDKFIIEIPIEFDSELLKIVNHLSIRNAWYCGKSLEEIVELDSKADKVCDQYYNFHFPWVVNAISKKMLLLGKKEEAKILEDISLFSEIGVPDMVSAQVYLAGIKSRKCSIELSKFVEEKDNIGLSIKKQLIQLISKCENGEINISEKAYEWLKLVNVDDIGDIEQELKPMIINLKTDVDSAYNKLFCKFYEERIYLCTWDYKVKLKIRKESMGKYKCLIGLLGVYFRRVEDNEWELFSENPYIIIAQN